MSLLDLFGIRIPIVLAPMGGGPGTPQLAAAVSNAGGLGSLAGAYLTPEQMRDEIARMRALTERPFAMNLFAGGYHSVIGREPEPMLAVMRRVHQTLGLPAPSLPPVPPDRFREQLAVVRDLKVPVFSFTFGIPDAEAIAALRAGGIKVVGTATTAEEGAALERAGVDAIVAQGAEAGAHRGTFLRSFAESMVPTLELVRALAARVSVPVIASGGIMTGSEIAEALRAGAEAVQLGTAFLACEEAGTPQAYRDALLSAREDRTVITRAFSGRAARGLRNAFIEAVDERIVLTFPTQNALTRPLRAAAAQQGNAEYLSLWAGTGVARIRSMPAAELVQTLMRELASA
jgi:nitronate monooxygenase